jgi:hypothetical protein
MPTRKQLANLRRGGVPGDAESAARARAAKARQRQEDEQIGEAAKEDARAALELMLPALVKHMLRLLRTEERERKQPSRNVTDRLRELRQTLEAVNQYRADYGADLEAEAFLASLDARMASAADRITAAGKPFEPVPAVEPR